MGFGDVPRREEALYRRLVNLSALHTDKKHIKFMELILFLIFESELKKSRFQTESILFFILSFIFFFDFASHDKIEASNECENCK